jgi:hypothetical protein
MQAETPARLRTITNGKLANQLLHNQNQAVFDLN